MVPGVGRIGRGRVLSLVASLTIQGEGGELIATGFSMAGIAGQVGMGSSQGKTGFIVALLELSHLPGAGRVAILTRLLELPEMGILVAAFTILRGLAETVHRGQVRSSMTLAATDTAMAPFQGKAGLIVIETGEL